MLLCRMELSRSLPEAMYGDYGRFEAGLPTIMILKLTCIPIFDNEHNIFAAR